MGRSTSTSANTNANANAVATVHVVERGSKKMRIPSTVVDFFFPTDSIFDILISKFWHEKRIEDRSAELSYSTLVFFVVVEFFIFQYFIARLVEVPDFSKILCRMAFPFLRTPP